MYAECGVTGLLEETRGDWGRSKVLCGLSVRTLESFWRGADDYRGSRYEREEARIRGGARGVRNEKGALTDAFEICAKLLIDRVEYRSSAMWLCRPGFDRKVHGTIEVVIEGSNGIGCEGERGGGMRVGEVGEQKK